MDHVRVLWSLLIDRSLQLQSGYLSLSVYPCDILHDTVKAALNCNMSGGRLVAIAVDPSDYSEKAFDCEFYFLNSSCLTIFYRYKKYLAIAPAM